MNNEHYLNEAIEKINKYQLFDQEYYIIQLNEEITIDPLMHYLTIGWKKGLNPSKKFDGNYYLMKHPDINKSKINPLIHYVLHGKEENREIKPDLSSRLITKEKYDILLKKDSYFENRWNYYEEVMTEIKKMNGIINVLEMGPYKCPLIEFEDVIDFTDDYIEHYPIEINKFIKHDCTKVPYPFKDKEYDLIIACQVLEHLGIEGEQINIFNELERISNMAIITLPYKWFHPTMRDHHMIDRKVIKCWAGGREPIFEKIQGHRILQIYKFD